MREERKRRRLKTRSLAWLLTFVMVMTLVVVPGKKAEAAERTQVTVNDAANTSNDVYIVLEKVKDIEANSNADHNWPSQALTEYKLYIKNGLEQNISDWSVTIQLAATPYWGYGYSGVTQSGNTISVVTYSGSNEAGDVWNNMTVEAGVKQDTGAGFAIPSSALNGATYTLTYYEGESNGTAGKDDAETDPAAIGETSVNVTANFTESNIAGEYHEYFLKVNNGLSESIGDWIIKIPMSGITGTEDWSSWADVVTYYTGECLYIIPNGGKVIAGNSSVGGTTSDAAGNYKINYKGSAALSDSAATVYFVKGSSSTGAFDSVVSGANGGNSSGGSGGGSGGTFDGENIGTIDTSTNYNFAKLLQLSLYFYDANMCGDRVSETSLYSTDVGGWRGDCHVNDYFTYKGTKYKAVGGFHDAGDHVKFCMPANEAFITLGISYLEFGQAFDELGQKEHFKTIVDYYCTYLKSCTVLDSTGNVAEAFCYQIGCGQKDHESWVAPEVEDESSTNRTYSLVATSSNPATEYVAGAAATLAINYLNFGNTEDLTYAKALFAMAKNNAKNKGSTDTSGSFYASGSWEDEYCLAAAMLYKITNDSAYATEYNNNNANASNIQKPNGWCNLYQFASYYAPVKNESEWNTINSWLVSQANSSTSSYYWGDDSWGTARINCNVQFSALLYDKLNNVDTYATWCRYQMSTILGNNSRKINLVCGYNEASPKKPHHRAASGYAGWTDFNNNATQKYTLYGALVGGPASSDFSTYKDAVNDAVSNEVTLDYNAGMVGSTAALYLLYKNSAEDGFTEQTVLSDFYGGSGFTSAQMPSSYSGGSGTPVVAVESISVTPETAADAPKVITIGETAAATVTVTPADANQNYSVASDKTSVATVTKTATGFQVAGKAAGTAAITVTASGDTTKKAVYYVKVVAPPITSVSLDKSSVTLDGTGKTATVAITIAPEAADQTKISVASGDEKVATVSVSGSALTITSGSKSGTATITVSSTEDTSIKAELAVTVKHSVTGFTLDTSEAELSINGTQTVNIETVEPENADLYKVLWSVDDGTIASISATEGESVTITGLKEGTTKVTAKIGTLNQSVDVTVSKSSQIKPEVTYDVLSQSSDAIRIKATANATEQENGALQLSTDKETWITGTSDVFTFDNLTSGSKYTIYARFAETDELSASQPATRTCDTYTVFDPATVKDGDAFVIDISKITAPDCDYVQMLATEVTNGIPSTVINVTEVDSTIVITTKDGNDYVIKGSNSQVDLVIKEGSDVSLLNATLGQVKADATTTISIQGNNKVTGGVSIAAGSTVTLKKKTDADASLQISNSEGSGISGEGNLKLESGDIDVSATGTNGDGIQVSDITVSGGSLVVSSEGGNGIIAQDVTISGGTVEVSTANGKGIEADSITMSGKNTKVNVTSADSALKATDISLDGADVSLEVTGTDASVVDASDKITLSSGSITTVKPADNHNADFKAEGDIVLGTDVSVSGSGTNVFSKEPVDSNGNIIKLVNVTVKDEYGETYAAFTYNANTTHVLSQEKKLAELALTQPYKELSFVNGDMELTLEDSVEVGTSDITLTIKWTPIVYTITYQLNGGTISGNKTEYTVDDKEYTLTTNVTRANYVFKGWYEDKNFKTPITFVSVEKNGNVTVYAKWEMEKPAAPRMTGTLNSEKGIVINWSAVKNVSGYEIWRSVNGGSFAKLATVTGTDKVSYEDINAAAGGTKYMYRVYAYKMVDGVQAQSAASNEMKVYRVVKAATPKAANVSNGVKISWTATPGATGYYVYRSISGGRYTKVASVTSRTYTDKKATSNGKNYRYKLVAYKTVDGTTFTGVESAERLIYRLSTPKITRLANTSRRSMTVKWARNKKASGYQVQYSTSNKFKKSVTKTRKISSYKTVSKVMKKLRKGKTYYVRIMSYKKVNGKIYTSGWSKTKKVKIKK